METGRRFPHLGNEESSLLDVGDLVTLCIRSGADGPYPSTDRTAHNGKAAVIVYRQGPLYTVLLLHEDIFLSYLFEDDMAVLFEFTDCGRIQCVN